MRTWLIGKEGELKSDGHMKDRDRDHLEFKGGGKSCKKKAKQSWIINVCVEIVIFFLFFFSLTKNMFIQFEKYIL